MAQVVKLEPGDVLVLANVGEGSLGDLAGLLASIREQLGVEHVLVFAGDVDLSKVPSGALARG